MDLHRYYNIFRILILFIQFQYRSLFPSFKDLIPNGHGVLNPCNPMRTWNGVGHINMYGSGQLNPFGEAFLRHGKNWTFALCQSDSDGDGRRNGEELGDPWCEWTPDSGANLPAPTSHPGVCDSITQCTSGEVTQFACPRGHNPPGPVLPVDPFNNMIFDPPPLNQPDPGPNELDSMPNFQFLGRSLRRNQEPPFPSPTHSPPPISTPRPPRPQQSPPLKKPPNVPSNQNQGPFGLFSPFSLGNNIPNEPKTPNPKPNQPGSGSRHSPSRPPSPFSLTGTPFKKPETPNLPLPPASVPSAGNRLSSRIGSPFSLANSVSSITPPPPRPPPRPRPRPPSNIPGGVPRVLPNIPELNNNPAIIPHIFPPMITIPNVHIPRPHPNARTMPSLPSTKIPHHTNTNNSDKSKHRNTIFFPPKFQTSTTPRNPPNNRNMVFPPGRMNNLIQRHGPFPFTPQQPVARSPNTNFSFSRWPFAAQNRNGFLPSSPGPNTSVTNTLPQRTSINPFSRPPFIRPNPNSLMTNTGAVPFPMIPRNQNAVNRFPLNTSNMPNLQRQPPWLNRNVPTQPAPTQPASPNSLQRLPNTANQRPQFNVNQVRVNTQRRTEDNSSMFVVRSLRRIMRPNFNCPGLTAPNTYPWRLRLPRVQIPTMFQSGVCMVFNLPSNGDFHLIGGTPLIDNRDAVQQMFVYGCDEDANVPVTSRPYACDGMPRRECQNIIGGYAGSIPGICFPRSGGIRMGRTGFKQIILQVRWVNLFGRFGMTDSSGMTIFYTNRLRQYDIGTKVLRATHFNIPPGMSNYTVTSTCPGECTVLQIRSPIYISMAFNHMHMLGRREKVELIRNGQTVDLITDESAFSYDDPKAYWHQTPIQILPGDSLRMSCEYNSMNMNGTVSWGFGESDEICLATLFYYPKESWETTSCTSFRSIPLCRLETTGIVQGCDFNNFFSTLRRDFRTAAVLANCTMLRVCNKDCQALYQFAKSHPCLKDDNYKLLESSIDISPDERLQALFETMKLCESGIVKTNPGIPILNNRRPINLLPEVETVKAMIRSNINTVPRFPTFPVFNPVIPLATVAPAPVIAPVPTPVPSPPTTTQAPTRTVTKEHKDENESVVRKSGNPRVKIIPINRNDRFESVQSTVIRLIQDHFRYVPISIVVISPDGLLRIENQVGLDSATDP